ncbi:hypothetical protein PGTUg99_011936 [Puccinia graminis f. sp. tritici]|uniref:Secreted protein n=1 Tax=Puccinia graminis f. sp. tritici TaxID=56615 RepID=A0A5B0N442_PUCGR|nr:hypothetical protein PGTUg99_011936 [Puccinia graminis f. sp. tritici]
MGTFFFFLFLLDFPDVAIGVQDSEETLLLFFGGTRLSGSKRSGSVPDLDEINNKSDDLRAVSSGDESDPILWPHLERFNFAHHCHF